MFNDIIIIDNFLNNANSLYELALTQQYYSAANNQTITNKFNYGGERTHYLKHANKKMNKTILDSIFIKLFNELTPKNSKIKFSYDAVCLFHSLTEKDKYCASRTHKDNMLYAGVLYLNKNVIGDLKNNGTIIYKNNQSVIVPYKYNRLLLYRSEYSHCPLAGFGDSVQNSRLSLNIFINKIDVSIKGTIIGKLDDNLFSGFNPSNWIK
jgi:hypothetical protein